MPTHDEALAVASALSSTALRLADPRSPLQRIWLYGSLTLHSPGADIDLVLEVDEATFRAYARHCAVELDGVNPMTNRLLMGDLSGPARDSFSPKEARCKAAITAIGLDPETLILPVGLETLDLICLPETWDNRRGSLYRSLSAHAALSHDPDFLDYVIDRRELVYPVATTT